MRSRSCFRKSKNYDKQQDRPVVVAVAVVSSFLRSMIDDEIDVGIRKHELVD